MRKIFIALAASLLVAVGSAAHINQVPARSLAQALKESNDKREYRPVSVGKLGEKKERVKRAKQEAGDKDEEDDFKILNRLFSGRLLIKIRLGLGRFASLLLLNNDISSGKRRLQKTN